jgi:hypothetical protein
VITSGLGLPIPAPTKPVDVGFASDRLPRIHETVQRYLDPKQLAGLQARLPFLAAVVE